MRPDERLVEAYQRAVQARTAPDRAECVSPEALLALVRREGREADRLATLDHAMACPACRDEFELLRSLERAGGEDVRHAVDGIRWKRNLSMALAASVVLAVGVGTGRRLLDRPERDVMRGDGSGITLIAPAEGMAARASTDSLTFVWSPVPGAETYLVEVLSADGSSVLSARTRDTTYTLRANDVPLRGEYRWAIQAYVRDGTEARSPARRLTILAP